MPGRFPYARGCEHKTKNNIKILYNMKASKSYSAPCILRDVPVDAPELLAGSVVTPKTQTRTVGQDVETHDFDQTGFNSTWE